MSKDRARRLRDQVLLTWRPPAKAGGETREQIAQTCSMQAICWIYPDLIPETLTANQRAAIDQGLECFEQHLPQSGT